jgi:beta-glucuronidase
MRRFLIALIASVAVLAGAGGAASAATLTNDVWYHDGPTDRWRIAGDWSFSGDDFDVGRGAGWADAVPEWARTVQVPYVWNADLDPHSFAGTVGWFWAPFTVAHDGLYRVRFLSTHHVATAWMDGQEIGEHEGGFLAWESRPVQLTAGEHLLAVRTDTRSQTTIAQTGGQGWWNWGGISREVELREVRKLDVPNVGFSTVRLGRRSAVVRVDVDVDNPTTEPQSGSVRVQLAGYSRATYRFTLAAGASRRLRLRLHTRGLARWSPAHPTLHPLAVFTQTDDADDAGPAWTGSVGIRRFTTHRSRLFLNGRRFFARGAALHDEISGVGAALTPTDLQANLDVLRGLHANFTRAHYPLHPGFLEMLDRAGILMWAEAPVAWLSNKDLNRRKVRNAALGYLRETITNQASHASVAVWSAGNELALSQRQGWGLTAYVRAARRVTKSLDPSRPFALAFQSRWPWEYKRFCRLVDVFGLNYYLGWYWGPPPGVRLRRALRENVEQKIGSCPRRPWLLTEIGAEAGFKGSAHQKGSYAYQRNMLRSTVQAVGSMRRLNGITIWAARDFAVAPGWTGGNDIKPNPPLNQKGLVTLSGVRKPAYFTVARLFARLARR